MNQKIITLKLAGTLAKKLKQTDQTIALITGCFDVIHMGHINFFRFARSQADHVFVGLDTDENIAFNKGPQRPLFTYAQRALVISEFQSIDVVFEMPGISHYRSNAADEMLLRVLTTIRPHYLISHQRDSARQRKFGLAEQVGAVLLTDPSDSPSSSTQIINSLPY